MRNWLMMSSLLALAACGLSEDKFNEKFGEKYCEELATCNPEMTCETSTGETETPADCEYDKKKAKECLDGEWTCNTEFEGFEFAEAPAACLEVYSCGGGTEE